MNDKLYQTMIGQAARTGFHAACFVAAAPEDGVGEGTLILLIRAYRPGSGLADAFYEASNAAHHQARALAQALCEQGMPAALAPNVRFKRVCNRLSIFRQGINTLHYLPGVGSRFCVEIIRCSNILKNLLYERLIILDHSECSDIQKDILTDRIHKNIDHCMLYDSRAAISKSSVDIPAEMPCASCGACAKACPTGAITKDGFDRARCLRDHMMRGAPVPEEYRALIGAQNGSYPIIGCDICQRVCPVNKKIWDAREPVCENENADDRSYSDPCLGDDPANNSFLSRQTGGGLSSSLPERQPEPFTLKQLLQCDAATLAAFAALYGTNYAIRSRIQAQAALAAGNTHDASYLPDLTALGASASPAVSQCASWAIARIREAADQR